MERVTAGMLELFGLYYALIGICPPPGGGGGGGGGAAAAAH